MKTLVRLEAALRRLEQRLAHPSLKRLRVRLRRRKNLLVAALLAFGILFMVLHWAGSTPPPRAPQPRRPAPAQVEAHAEAGR